MNFRKHALVFGLALALGTPSSKLAKADCQDAYRVSALELKHRWRSGKQITGYLGSGLFIPMALKDPALLGSFATGPVMIGIYALVVIPPAIAYRKGKSLEKVALLLDQAEGPSYGVEFDSFFKDALKASKKNVEKGKLANMAEDDFAKAIREANHSNSFCPKSRLFSKKNIIKAALKQLSRQPEAEPGTEPVSAATVAPTSPDALERKLEEADIWSDPQLSERQDPVVE